MRRLDAGVNTETPEDGLVLGETLLAGAHLLRSLASKDAVLQKDVMVGGQRVETGKRFVSLMTLSDKVEEAAWEALEPYLRRVEAEAPAAVTDTNRV